MADLNEVGGPAYAQLCAMAYRQAIGAHKLAAGPQNKPMMFSKECFSNGCIATVDVAYPAAPIFMLLSNEMLKATVRPSSTMRRTSDGSSRSRRTTWGGIPKPTGSDMEGAKSRKKIKCRWKSAAT